MVSCLCFRSRRPKKTELEVCTTSESYHPRILQISPIKKAIVSNATMGGLDQKWNNAIFKTERHSASSLVGIPLGRSRSVTLIKDPFSTETESVEVIEQNYNRSEFEMTSVYSTNSTSENSLRKDRCFITYCEVSPCSTSTFSFNRSMSPKRSSQSLSLRTRSISHLSGLVEQPWHPGFL